MRASVLSRLAHGYATAGRSVDFERTSGLARDLIEQQSDTELQPRCMYFLTPSHLECQAAYSLVGLGRAVLHQGGHSVGRSFVRQGEALLETGAHAVEKGDPSQRRAPFEGAWLALGYSVSSELERACDIARTAASRLTTVQSARSATLLRQLAVEVRRKQRNPHVSNVLPELEVLLAKYAGAAAGRPDAVGASRLPARSSLWKEASQV